MENRQVSSTTCRFSSVGNAHPQPESAASAFKEFRESAHSILHWFGSALVVFLSRRPFIILEAKSHEFSRQLSHDLGKLSPMGCVSRQRALSLSNSCPQDVDLGSIVGSGVDATLPASALTVQRVVPSS